MEVIGPAAFCFINAIPQMAVIGFLMSELFRTSPIPFMPVLQLGIIVVPFILHAVALMRSYLGIWRSEADHLREQQARGDAHDDDAWSTSDSLDLETYIEQGTF